MKRIITESQRTLLTALGVVCIILGVIGIVLPVVPTTPFILAAAWCFSRSNQRFYQWLLNHKLFGIHLQNWINNVPIPRKNYLGIMLMLWFGLALSTALTRNLWIALALLTIGLSVSTFLWTRSEFRKKNRLSES